MTAAKPFVVDDTVVKEKTLFVICDRFFYEIFGKFAAAQRADVGIGPYSGYAFLPHACVPPENVNRNFRIPEPVPVGNAVAKNGRFMYNTTK